MGIADLGHEFEDLKDIAEEKIGDLPDNESLQAEGLAEQAKAKAEEAAHDDWRAALAGEDADQLR